MCIRGVVKLSITEVSSFRGIVQDTYYLICFPTKPDRGSFRFKMLEDKVRHTSSKGGRRLFTSTGVSSTIPVKKNTKGQKFSLLFTDTLKPLSSLSTTCYLLFCSRFAQTYSLAYLLS